MQQGLKSRLGSFNSFTNYSSITEANALAWTKAKIGSDEVSALENVLQKELKNKT